MFTAASKSCCRAIDGYMLSLPLWSSLIFFFCRQYWDHHQISWDCLHLWSWWASVCNSQLYPGWVKIIFQEEQIVSESDLFRMWWWSWGWFGRNWGKCKVGRQSGKFWGGGSNFQPKHETFARTQSRLDKTFCCDKNRDEEEKEDKDILESRLGCVVSQFDLA